MNLNEQSSKSNQSCRHKKPKKRSGGGGEIRRGVVFGGEGNWVNGIHAEYYRVVGGTPPPHTHESWSHTTCSVTCLLHRP